MTIKGFSNSRKCHHVVKTKYLVLVVIVVMMQVTLSADSPSFQIKRIVSSIRLVAIVNGKSEPGILKATKPCHVHTTFDCTGPRKRCEVPKHPRLHFHHTCIAPYPQEQQSPCSGAAILDYQCKGKAIPGHYWKCNGD